MDSVTLAIAALSSIRLLLSNPALNGAGTVKTAQASEILGTLTAILAHGDDAYDDLKEFTATVAALVASKRQPNRAEWDILRSRSDDAHARMQAVKEELLGEGEGEAAPTSLDTPAETGEETPTSEGSEGDGDDENTAAPV